MCAVQFLNAELPFDEAALLEENKEYFQRSSKLEAITVQLAPADGTASKDTLKAEPGAPAFVFLKKQ